MAEFRIETDRLILREWRDADLERLHQICSDVRVMQFIGPLQTAREVFEAVELQKRLQVDTGCCYWALECRTEGRLIGFCGLMLQGDEMPIAGKTDIGWRLAHHSWGQGYAREAAQATLNWGFANLADERIWAITTPNNLKSWGLMERLGMVRHPELDFNHPNVADDSPLKAHITYSIARPA